ncbi:MAG: acyl-ACP--UDP-N-acetylglucosamine O-acyltransferase [Chthoniobacterales bacterium]
MPIIHPSAIVDPSAELADDVIVGPWALVEAGAKIGAGCRLLGRAVVGGQVRMGANNIIGYGVILGGDPQSLGFQSDSPSKVVIGDENIFREYVTIHRGDKEGTQTMIGNKNFLMVGAHIGHNTVIGNQVVIANNCLLAGYVEVQDRANLGGGSVYHQFVRIGKLAMVQGGTRYSKDIPPYLMAYGYNEVSGLNAVGLRRAGLSSAVRMELKKAFRLLYREGLNISQALAEADKISWSSEVKDFFEFVRQAKRRGVCHARSIQPNEDEGTD